VTNSSKHARTIIPVVEEQAVVHKRKKLTEGVRVRTVVHEAQEVIDEPLATEDIAVERTPLDRWVDAPVPVRHEGDVTIVTLVEEVVVVETVRDAVRKTDVSIKEVGTKARKGK
jgi:stress response protein YsnF